jgi:hypothetical protein
MDRQTAGLLAFAAVIVGLHLLLVAGPAIGRCFLRGAGWVARAVAGRVVNALVWVAARFVRV